MTSTPTDMLKRLAGSAPGVSLAPGASTGRPSGPAAGLEALDFAQLLGKAQAGQLSTSLPVTVDSKSGMELSPEQLGRVAKAADRAEAEGFAMAVVHIDGQNLLLDVQARRITGRVDGTTPVAKGIDGVVYADPTPGSPEAIAAADALVRGDKLLATLKRPLKLSNPLTDAAAGASPAAAPAPGNA